MFDIKEIALSLFSLEEGTRCKDITEHQVCLFCNKCRAERGDQMPTELLSLNQYIEHTILRANATSSDIFRLCEEADIYGFRCVCVNPTFINLVRNSPYSPPICTVIGFPLGANTIETKAFEAKNAIVFGVKEIDMVMNIGALKEGNYGYVFDEIAQIANLCKDSDVLLKVILEISLLTKEEIIKACLIAKKAGADFVKTSTSFSTSGADIETVRLMREIVGHKVGIKASGGIKTKATVIAMLKAGANRIGTSSSVNIMNDI
jgi:deoxyribose-phosphate aldolase